MDDMSVKAVSFVVEDRQVRAATFLAIAAGMVFWVWRACRTASSEPGAATAPFQQVLQVQQMLQDARNAAADMMEAALQNTTEVIRTG